MQTMEQAFSALEEQLSKARAEIKAAEQSKSRIWDEVQTARTTANKEIAEIRAERKAERERVDADLPKLQEEERKAKTYLDNAQQKLKEAKQEAETVIQNADRIHRAAEAEAAKFMDAKRKIVDDLRAKYHAFRQALPESF